MFKPGFDQIEPADQLVEPPKKKFKFFSKPVIYLLVIFVISVAFFAKGLISSGEKLSEKLGNVSLWSQIQHLITSGDKKLIGETDDRINVALLGIGGLEHDGPFLTDTMIIASIKPSTKKVALMSVPRDLVAPIPGYGWRKINNADSFGEVKNPGHGGLLATEVLSETFGIPITYYLRLDFSGFEKVIDDLGGITVDVDNLLDDEKYPIPGKENAPLDQRYEHLMIKPGTVAMNGTLALKYVRSRQAHGIEGSDFARSKRQQKVLMAVKKKALSLGTLANPVRISHVMDTLSEHLATNMEVWQMFRLFTMANGIDETSITRRVFDSSPDGQLFDDITPSGEFVLRPKAGDFSQLQNIAQNIFDTQAIAKLQPKIVEVENGTKISGLASRTADYLKSLGYQANGLRNAPTQDYKKTVVYNLTTDHADQTAANVAKLLNAELSPVIPAWVTTTTPRLVNPGTNVLVILGQDRENL